MPCNDSQEFTFEGIAPDAVYELSVDGPPGTFTTLADFIEAPAAAMTEWPGADISPGPKQQPLHTPHVMHSVSIFTTIVSIAPVTITVKASVTGQGSFCREITGRAGTSERIKHILRMA